MSDLVRPTPIPFLLEAAAARWPDFDVSDFLPSGPDLEWVRPGIQLYTQSTIRMTDVSWVVTVAYRVLAGSREFPDEADAIAREVEAFLWNAWKLPGANPVAAATDSAGPNEVPNEHEPAVLFGTVDLVIAGVYHPAKTG